MGATFVPEQSPFLVYKRGSGSTSATQSSCFHSFWLPERWCIHLTPPALWVRKQEGAPHLTISVQMWGGDLVKDSRLVLTASLQPRETTSLYAPEIRTEPKASWRRHNRYPGLVLIPSVEVLTTLACMSQFPGCSTLCSLCLLLSALPSCVLSGKVLHFLCHHCESSWHIHTSHGLPCCLSRPAELPARGAGGAVLSPYRVSAVGAGPSWQAVCASQELGQK